MNKWLIQLESIDVEVEAEVEKPTPLATGVHLNRVWIVKGDVRVDILPVLNDWQRFNIEEDIRETEEEPKDVAHEEY